MGLLHQIKLESKDLCFALLVIIWVLTVLVASVKILVLLSTSAGNA